MKLLVSSLLFLTNFIHNTYYQKYVYAWLFLLLTVTSVFIHSEIFMESFEIHNFILFIDKMVIINIFFTVLICIGKAAFPLFQYYLLF
jgi:hypothetical protein